MNLSSNWSNWQSGSFRVRPHRPWRTILVLVIIGAALTIGAWWLYERGRQDGGYEARMARATEAHLRLDIEELRDQIGEMTKRNTLLERADRIDRDAIGHLREEIESRERRIDELEEELAFYRNLVSPSDTGPGLHVRRLSLSAIPGTERQFRYELVLTQLNGNDRYADGRVDLSLAGNEGPDTRSLAAEQFLVEEESSTNFRFKYFQTLTGVIELPRAFEPTRLELKVMPAGGRLDAIEEDFAWDSLVSGGA